MHLNGHIHFWTKEVGFYGWIDILILLNNIFNIWEMTRDESCSFKKTSLWQMADIVLVIIRGMKGVTLSNERSIWSKTSTSTQLLVFSVHMWSFSRSTNNFLIQQVHSDAGMLANTWWYFTSQPCEEIFSWSIQHIFCCQSVNITSNNIHIVISYYWGDLNNQ